MRIQHESKGRPTEKKIPTVVIYKKPTGKKHYMLIDESGVDDVIDSLRKKPLIPNNYEIFDIGIA